MSNTIRILVVEDNPNDYELAQREIRSSLETSVFKRVETQKDYLDELKTFQPDVILCDYSLPSFDGMKALKLAREQSPLTPLIMWTGSISEDVAVECMMAGAANYVIKDNLKRLGPAVIRAIEESKLAIEHKQAQELILNLSRFPEENPNPIMRATRNGTVLYANSASKVWVEYMDAFGGNELPAHWKQVVATAFDQNAKQSMDVVIRDRFYSVMVVPFHDAGYVNLYGTDITELKQAQREFEDIVEGSPVGIFQSTPAGRFISANSTMAHILGYSSPAELINSVSDIEAQFYLSAQDRTVFTQLLETADAVRNFEMKNLRRDGSVIWTSTSARAVRDSEGKILYYEGFIQDITERKQAQAQVDDLLSFNEKILSHSPLGILTYKLTGECVFANNRAASIVGTTVENLKSQNFHRIESWKSSGLYALAENAVSTKTMSNGDIHLVSSFGKETWLAARCVTFQAMEEEHLLLTLVDITERKQTEEELRQKNEDLRLLNMVNNAVVRGQDLESTIDLLTREMKRIFSAVGSTIYMLSADQRFITMHQYAFSPETERRIEKLIGFRIPKIEIPVQEGGHFHNALITRQSAITSEPQKIREWITEFVETKFLPSIARAAVRKLVPHIYKLLNIRSTIIVPLIAQDDVLGFLDLSSSNLFTTNDLRRIETIGEQLTLLMQRQQINERVRKSEEFLQGIQNSLSAHVAILNEQGVIIQVNEAWRKFGDQHGLQSADYGVGTNYLAICESARGDDAEIAQKVADAIRQVISGAKDQDSVEYPFHNATLKRWFVVHITCFDDGKQKWLILAHENITERKLVEEELRQSELRYRSVVEHQTEFIVRWRPDGSRTFVNDAYCHYFGLTRERALDTSFVPLIYAEDQEFVAQKIERLLTGVSNVETDSHRVVRFDGSICWNEWTEQAIYDESGQLIEILAVGRDITERKQAESAMLESQERYQDLFDKSPISLWEEDYSPVKRRIDALREEGITDFSEYFKTNPSEVLELASLVRITDVNKTTLDLFGAQDKAQLLQDLKTLMKEDVSRHFQAELLGLMSPTRGFVWEGPDKTFDGQALEVIVRGTIPSGYEKDWSKVIVSIVDITERKRAEARVRESEERYRALFEEMPVAVWEDDLSVIKEYLDHLKQQGINDLREYFDAHPEELVRTRKMVRILDVNKTAMEMYQSVSKDELIRSTVEYMGPGEKQHWIDDLIAIANGQTTNRWEGGDLTMNDIPIEISLTWTVVPGHEHDFSRVIFTTVDITERKQAEKELRQEQEKAQKYLDIAGVMMLALDQDGNLSMINQKGCEILGYSNDEIIGRNWINTVIPEDMRDELQDVLQKLVNEDIAAASYYENPIVTKGGEQRMIAWHNTLVRDENGKVITSLSSGEDITERRRAENELRVSEERFRQLANNIEEVFWMTEAQTGRELYASPAAEKVWGIPVDELQRESDFYIKSVLPADRSLVLHGIEREKNGEKVEMEYRITRADGAIRWIWDRAFPIFDDDGKVKILAGISTDITERKLAEEQLRKFSLAVEQSGSTIVITDREGNIEYVNPQFIKTTGYSFDEALGKNPRILKTEYMTQEEYKQLWATITSGGQWRGELYNKAKDGRLYWEYATVSPIQNAQGEITHFIAVKEDITERKHNELEIQHHLAELEALYENGLAIGRLLEPKEIGDQMIQTFAQYLSWHHVAIRLLDPDTDKLELIAFNQPGLSDDSRAEMEIHLKTMVSKLGQGLSGWAIQTGEAIRTGDVHTHPQYTNTHAAIISGLYMPLKVGDRVIGCISVESDQPDAFSEEDQRLLATMANQAAIAFENARLYQATQQELRERERAQQALWTSETHYRQLADSITDILFELDQDLRYTHWNKASEMFSGIPAEDAIGKSMQDIWGEGNDVLNREEIYRSVLRERQARTFEIEVNRGGEKRNLEISAYPSAHGVSVVARDITERKLAEELASKRIELIEYSTHHSLDEVLQKVTDDVSELTHSHIGFLHLVDADQQTIHLQTWSTETMEIFCDADTIGQHAPLDQAGVWADAVRAGHSVIHNNYETLLEKRGLPEGHARVYREMVIPIIRNEKTVAVIGVGNKEFEYTEHDISIAERFADYAWDITERKRIENELAQERNLLARRVEERTADLSRANSNLARALRVKDEFLANMSHELRTPLNAILGLSESLSEQVAGPLNEKQFKYLSTINESGHHLLSLINDILDLAKIDAGQITLDINKVDVNSVAQASLRMIKQLAQKKNQEVSFEIDPNLGLMWADERRLKQMMVNLLSNAVKFTPDSGRLGLEVHGDKDGNKVIITVWDRGIGISENDIQRLFKPFVQLDAGLAREATGTGLGLALVAQMAKMHGGSVTVESQVGHGSRFTIMLPWEPALAGDSDSRLRTTGKFQAIKPNQVRPTILLVEDTQEVVMMLVDYLEMSGFNMVTAQDGIDGLIQAKIAHPDLILMDVQMPRMDGFETTKKLRSDPEFKDTPIIALTALAMPNDRQRCIDAGMDEYLSKPVNLKSLSKTIKAFLYNQEANQP